MSPDPSPEDQEEIFRAVRFNDATELKRLLTPFSSSIHLLKVESYTLLMLAVQSEALDCAKVLVEDFKVDILQGISTTNDVNAVHIAIYEESRDFVEYFLKFDSFTNNLSRFFNPVTLQATIDHNLPIMHYLASRNLALFKIILKHIVSHFTPLPPLDLTLPDISSSLAIRNASVLLPVQQSAEYGLLSLYNFDFVDKNNHTVLTHLLQQRDDNLIFNDFLPYFLPSTDLTLTNVGRHGSVMQDLFVAYPLKALGVFIKHVSLTDISFLTFPTTPTKLYSRSFLSYIMAMPNNDIFTPVVTKLNDIAQVIQFAHNDAKFLSDAILPQFYALQAEFESKSLQIQSLGPQIVSLQSKIDQNIADNTYNGLVKSQLEKVFLPLQNQIDVFTKQINDIVYKMDVIKTQFPEALITFQLYLQLQGQYLDMSPAEQYSVSSNAERLQELCVLVLTLISRTKNFSTGWNIFYLKNPKNSLNLFHQAMIKKNILLAKVFLYYSLDPMTPINSDNATILHLPELLENKAVLEWFIGETSPSLLFSPTKAGVTPMMVATLHLDSCRQSIDYIFQQYSSGAAVGNNDGSSTNLAPLTKGLDISHQLFSSSSLDKDSFLDILLAPGSPIKTSALWEYLGLSEQVQLTDLMFHPVFCRNPRRLSFLLDTQSSTPISIDVKNQDGDTLLLHCLKNGFIDTIPALIKLRANIFAVNTKTLLNAFGTLAVYQLGVLSDQEYERALLLLTNHYSSTAQVSNDFLTKSDIFSPHQLQTRVLTQNNLNAIHDKIAKIRKLSHAPAGVNINFDFSYTYQVSQLLFDELHNFGSSFDFDTIVAYCYLGADLSNALMPYHVTPRHRKVFGYIHITLLALFDLNLNEPVVLLPTQYKGAVIRPAFHPVSPRASHATDLLTQVDQCLRLFAAFSVPWNHYASPLHPDKYGTVITNAVTQFPSRKIADTELDPLPAQKIITSYHGNYPMLSHGIGPGTQSHRLALQGYFSQPTRFVFLTPLDILGLVISYNNSWLFNQYTESPNTTTHGQHVLDPQLAKIRGLFLDSVMKIFMSLDVHSNPSNPFSLSFDNRYTPLNYLSTLKMDTSTFVLFPESELKLIQLLATSPFVNKSITQVIEKWFHYKQITQNNKLILEVIGERRNAAHFDPDNEDSLKISKSQKKNRKSMNSADGGDANDLMVSSKILQKRSQVYDEEFGTTVANPNSINKASVVASALDGNDGDHTSTNTDGLFTSHKDPQKTSSSTIKSSSQSTNSAATSSSQSTGLATSSTSTNTGSSAKKAAKKTNTGSQSAFDIDDLQSFFG